jgi:predicted ATP-binding protein involved in virulence
MKIENIKLKNYRSFDNDGIELNNLGNVNILIGKNNSGKSNLLNFIGNINQFFEKNASANGYLQKKDFYNFNEGYEVICSLNVNKNMLEIPESLLTYFKNENYLNLDYIYSPKEGYFVISESLLKNKITNLQMSILN